MRYVLDTHAVIFALAAPKKLGTEARRVLRRIERGQDEGLIPAAVGAEIAMLRELGRTELGVPELKVALDESPGLRFLSLDLAQVEIFAMLQPTRSLRQVDRQRVTGNRCPAGDQGLSDQGIGLGSCRLVGTAADLLSATAVQAGERGLKSDRRIKRAFESSRDVFGTARRRGLGVCGAQIIT